ncbi:MAG TPA: D-glycero-beta-D-manno-heptose-7-phosphate kinase [bacterium]|nr:D-glycero-beta-D-manno-heptose-7-phosphate kinase [bacterium]HMY34677.1 D-glycero-beta-D-manno-heptose-7-phosphate kinase [bacterium]HMZ03275.1 D-glycero-beta-D-manno-heptose-7-phosphate kinase [bacterium]HNC47908.1 D-glycero-beta-D-manno-heptose-7-phosphate kinase [bacterium]HND77210.1 D-glycero-beta-D-manno-heptose-7-phosphate kinase [bacterium]
MNLATLRQKLLDSSRPKILVVGDIILDKFIWGSVDRISPEAPVQVVNMRRETLALGGAANVAHNLAAIACDVTMLGVIGQDAHGAALKEALGQAGIHSSHVVTDTTRPTTTKTRVMAGSQHVVRIDNEVADAVSPDVENQIIASVKKIIGNVDAVIISDYQKGVLTDKVLLNTIQLARQAGVPSIVDPKRRDFSAYSGATIIKPNLKEAEAATGKKLTNADEVLKAGRSLVNQYQTDAVLITRGKDGMMLVEARTHTSIAATAREVFDVTGAGDTVSAFLGMMLASKATLAEAAEVANLAAGVAVSRMGTVTVTREEVLHQMEQSASGSRKILTAGEASVLIAGIRGKKKIVFTNGCFDILHVGHITLLNQARALGDALVVGLNSDASVRRLKGEKRPIVSEQERAHILAALASVDYVVLFDEDTPLELIRQIQPDILVKGSDYTLDRVVGRAEVESYGGRVALVDLVVGFSTTNIVESILQAYGVKQENKTTDDKNLAHAENTMQRITSLQDRYEEKIDRIENKNKSDALNALHPKKK